MNIFSSNQKSYLGVDIGTSGVKIVEIKKENNQPKLFSYGFSETISVDSEKTGPKEINDIAKLVNAIHKKAGMVSRVAVSALPTFSVFTSILTLTNVDRRDMASAVNWEAKKVIPLPLEEMVLDWVEIDENNNGKKGDNKNNENQGNAKKVNRVLLTGASRSLVERYISIFKIAHK